jgi:ABC transporter permease protein
MEKSINIQRVLRATLRLLFTSILILVFGAIGVLIGLLAEIIAGVIHIL